MVTPNYNLPTISGNMAADVVRDMNALAEATDSAIKEAIDNVDLSGINTKLDTHIKDDLGHVKYVGTSSGDNALTIVTDLIPVVNPNAATPVPKEGVAFRFRKTGSTNTGPMTLTLTINGKKSATYPVYTSGRKPIPAGTMAPAGIYTVAFNSVDFTLQGESGVTSPTNGSQTFSTPGTYSFTVPEGVTRLTYRAWGAGGGGGGSSAYRGYTAGGGGGAGAYASGCLNVTPGDILTVTVGKGGDGGLPNTDENNDRMLLGGTGGASNISGPKNSIPYLVGGGGGGSCGFNNNVGRAGGGGSITNGDSFIPYDTPPKQGYPIILGSGLAGYIFSFIMGTQGQYAGSDTYNGGGGAGGSSDAAAGNLAYVNNGGAGASFYTFYPGAKGGDGGYSFDGKDAAGVGAGGGGGGTYKAVGISHKKGGKGGDGRVILYW